MIIIMPPVGDWVRLEYAPNTREYAPEKEVISIGSRLNKQWSNENWVIDPSTHSRTSYVSGDATVGPNWTANFTPIGTQSLGFSDVGGSVSIAPRGTTTIWYEMDKNGGLEGHVRTNPTDAASREYIKFSNVVGRKTRFEPIAPI